MATLKPTFTKVLIANRGTIACRIIRTLRSMGLKSVAVYSEADRGSLHVSQADEAVCIGEPEPAHSYLNWEKIIAAAKSSGAGAIHPGYGFLSENAQFAQACEEAGLCFMGPTAEQMRAFGLKHAARALAKQNQVPLTPGSDLLPDRATALEKAQEIGYPVMLKSTAGGGGIGMKLCRNAAELEVAFEQVQRLAQSHFGQAGAFVERYVEEARHIEVQLFGDGQGKVIALGERDCSAQRRNQKVMEEAPAPGLSEAERRNLHDTAIRLAQAIQYRSAGTAEFLFDVTRRAFYFLEVNTRLQVEHGVTEEIYGVDLVEWMVRLAQGEPLESFATGFMGSEITRPKPHGHSIQVRLYAENAVRNFQPSTGVLSSLQWDAEARVETWVEVGTEITSHYDPMIAKIIVWGEDRAAALKEMTAALKNTEVTGLVTNLDYLRQVVSAPEFIKGGIKTAFLGHFTYQPQAFEVVQAGPQTTVQDYPGRIGYWDVGVPPSGPMDSLSFRQANLLLGNAPEAAGLEFTLAGPTLRFHSATRICITGAEMKATLNGDVISRGRLVDVTAGALLQIGPAQGLGMRGYLAVEGGIESPLYLGSRSTFDLGKFGGPYGRPLQMGDLLFYPPKKSNPDPVFSGPSTVQVELTQDWKIGVLYGPHGAPDFFTEADIETLFSATYKVHHNSNRTGIRLTGPKPQWARRDGGEAGLHPSNIHDNAYAIGAIDFTGDMPILLGPDGPSLGGFVCPAVVAQAEIWKLGQLKPGDSVQFIPWSWQKAREATLTQANALLGKDPATQNKNPNVGNSPVTQKACPDAPVLYRSEAKPGRPAFCLRRAGDAYLLAEYGPLELDLRLRFRAQALMEKVKRQELPGILDLTPGIRSLQIHYDGSVLALEVLVNTLLDCESDLPETEALAFESRIVHLPLSWDDEAIHRVIERYTQSVRPDAPWCPSNIEFIRRINGLDSIEAVKNIIFSAHYLVMGLGDVYLGAPVATPLDPRHRLVTTKYNPARTWTVENVVGIGGAYLCIYGMEGPGGYQLFGRTCQVWNTHRVTDSFVFGKPWLLRFFDQICFYPVSPEALQAFRADFVLGKTTVRTEPVRFVLRDYLDSLENERPAIEAFQKMQRAAFEAERERWAAAGLDQVPEVEASGEAVDLALGAGQSGVSAPLTGTVLRLPFGVGEKVQAGQTLVALESMKMEFPAEAPVTGIIRHLHCTVGQVVQAGQTLVVIDSGE